MKKLELIWVLGDANALKMLMVKLFVPRTPKWASHGKTLAITSLLIVSDESPRFATQKDYG